MFAHWEWISLYTSGMREVYELPIRVEVVCEDNNRKELFALIIFSPFVTINGVGYGTVN